MNPKNRAVSKDVLKQTGNPREQILGPNHNRRGVILNPPNADTDFALYSWQGPPDNSNYGIKIPYGAAPMHLCYYLGHHYIQGALYGIDTGGNDLCVMDIVEIPGTAEEDNGVK